MYLNLQVGVYINLERLTSGAQPQWAKAGAPNGIRQRSGGRHHSRDQPANRVNCWVRVNQRRLKSSDPEFTHGKYTKLPDPGSFTFLEKIRRLTVETSLKYQKKITLNIKDNVINIKDNFFTPTIILVHSLTFQRKEMQAIATD